MKKLLIILCVLFMAVSVQAEWNCPDCPPGPPGPPGPQGPQGPPGSDGSNGGDGLNGRNGTNGLNGRDGSDGLDGSDGSQGYALADSCPDCFNDRIDMAVATLAAIPDTVLFHDKKAAFFFGIGQAHRSVAVGFSTVVRINGSWVVTGGVGANITDNCGEYCVDAYDTFEYITSRVAIGYQY